VLAYVVKLSSIDYGTIDTDAQIATTALRHNASKASAKTACHPRLQRELGGDVARCA
jgi:hypothetical protein